LSDSDHKNSEDFKNFKNLKNFENLENLENDIKIYYPVGRSSDRIVNGD